MATLTPETEELDQKIRALMRSPLPTNLIYAGQSINEIDKLKLYFDILQDVLNGDTEDGQKLKKVEYLLGEFEDTFNCWTELTISVLEDIPKN